MAKQTSKKARAGLVAKVQSKLGLSTKKEAELIIKTITSSIEETLMDNLETDGFSLKLYGLGKLVIAHHKGGLRYIPFAKEMQITDDTRKVKFFALGSLLKNQKVTDKS
jgi:nucleoid DNA-binding protein